jgi:hypothetical protein
MKKNDPNRIAYRGYVIKLRFSEYEQVAFTLRHEENKAFKIRSAFNYSTPEEATNQAKGMINNIVNHERMRQERKAEIQRQRALENEDDD